MRLTRITSDSGLLTKLIGINPDGSLAVTTCANMIAGKAERLDVQSFDKLAAIVTGLESKQALVHSHFEHDSDNVNVVTDAALNGQADTISRTKQFFIYRADASPISFDYDGNAKLSRDDLLAKYIRVWSGFDGAGYVHVPSSSGGLFKADGSPLPDSTGQRFLFGVKDATDIPRFSRALFERCWLAGFGDIVLSKTGAMLRRTIFDAAVHTSERLDFLADPILNNGLTQKRAVHSVEGHLLDTHALPDLNADERQEFEQLVQQAEAANQRDADRIRREYIVRQASKLDMDREDAERVIEQRLEFNLLACDVLKLDDKSTVTVLDVLIDPHKFEGVTLYDPIEPELKNKARLYWNSEQGEIRIFSQLHGGQEYVCRFDFDSLKKHYQSLPDDDEKLHKYARLLKRSTLSPAEQDRFFRLVKERTGSSLEAIKQEAQQGFEKMLTHDEMAREYTKSKGVLQYADGAIWQPDDKHIWQRKSDDHAQAEIGQMFIEQRLCKTQSAYRQIVEQVHNVNSNPNFFTDAQIGIACPSGFFFFDGDEIKQEPLTMSHRQRFFLPHDPDDRPPTMFLEFLHDCFVKPRKFDRTQFGVAYDEKAQIKIVQELFGVTMFGMGCAKEKAFFLFGDGNSGKSTLLRVLEANVPSEFVCAVPPGKWGDPYHSAMLAGMRLVSVGETDDQVLGAGFKAYTGRDLQNARHPGGRPFSHRPSATCVFNANDFPPLKDRSAAMFRRLKCLGFFNSRVEKAADNIDDLHQRIIDNEQGRIIAWGMAGAKRVIKNNVYTSSAVDDTLLDAWKYDADSVAAFLIDTDFILTTKTCGDEFLVHGLRENRAEVYRCYKVWCKEQGIHFLSAKKFGKDMIKLGNSPTKYGGNFVYRDVQLTGAHERLAW